MFELSEMLKELDLTFDWSINKVMQEVYKQDYDKVW